ncbi:MSCRAMM family adhesin SdrC [Dyadobacter sp. CY343]|uniref:MSCRAMM family adhesin SdrC n=1 Tax=Dyadobacter sp. CY343 TaxID=2907299 RepID=UPI001F406D99|nr:MSCRAMM family adhesin SdrC [Dyadobacter sp. CY343]MCE7059232.1 MSCRAMM family adhesin SdrC [Dyadobacter sp. CY343]
MNPIDFEKTQLFADRAKEMHASQETTLPNPEAVPPIPPAAVTPNVKTLSKEEKIALATGSILFLGLGTIVIAGMDSPETPAVRDSTTTISPVTPVPDAPVIETDSNLNIAEPVIEEKPDIPVFKPAQQPPTATGGSASQVSHALFTIPEELAVATDVTDDMPFEAAFNTARAEVGPGGLFVWNNTYYGTFRESEWNGLADEQKQTWLNATQPIIDPIVPEPDPVADKHVVVAERGEITWTGIDKDEDGIAEVLIAYTKGTAPIVMMDTDGDKLLDTRYSMEANGQVISVVLEKTSFALSDVRHIPEMELESVFGNVAGQAADPGEVPVTILLDNWTYVVGIDLDDDKLVDVVSLRRDGESPFVAMDMDNDGQVETSFLYNADSRQTESVTMDPLQPMTVYAQPDASDDLYGANNDTPDFDADLDSEKDGELADASADQQDSTDLHAYSDPYEDQYFNNNADSAEDFIG